MHAVRNYIELIFILTVLYFVIFKKLTLVEAYVLVTPFYGIDYEVGLRLTLSQIVLLLLNIRYQHLQLKHLINLSHLKMLF